MTHPALPFPTPDPFSAASASVEPDPGRRYLLVRRWAPGALCGWVCLNPSTADADVLDPTTRRILGYSRAWGYGGFALVNLFAHRATDPRDLLTELRGPGYHDAVGAENDEWTARLASECPVVVCAWGSPKWGEVLRRSHEVHRAIAATGKAHRLGAPLKGGHPRHPLYAHGSLRPVPHPYRLEER